MSDDQGRKPLAAAPSRRGDRWTRNLKRAPELTKHENLLVDAAQKRVEEFFRLKAKGKL